MQTNKNEIKKFIKEVLIEIENEDKKNKFKKSLKNNKDKTFNELLKSSSLDLDFLFDYDFQKFNSSTILSDLDTSEQEVQNFIKNEINPECQIDTSSYYIKINHLEQFRLLIKTIEEFKVKIDLILMGRNPF